MSAPTPAKADETKDLRDKLGRLWCKAEGLDPDDVISDAGHTVLCATLGGLDPKVTAAFNEAAAPIIAAHAAEIQALRNALVRLCADVDVGLHHEEASEIPPTPAELRLLAVEARERGDDAEARADWLAAENAKMAAALKPFVNWIDAVEVDFGDEDDERTIGGVSRAVVTFGDLRAARAALPEAITPKETSNVQD